MRETWKKAGQSGLPHLIKLAGDRYYTTGCRVTLARDTALSMDLQRVNIAGAPGKYVMLPKEPCCPLCRQIALAQA
jgi:hypothetical protein